jgi:hypothetical protein
VQAVDSRFRHFASCFLYCKKTWNRAKTIFGVPAILPPPQKKSIFFQEQEISQEREFVVSQFGDYKKMFLIVQTYLVGQSLCSPHLTPQIQCLRETKEPTQQHNWKKVPPAHAQRVYHSSVSHSVHVSVRAKRDME